MRNLSQSSAVRFSEKDVKTFKEEAVFHRMGTVPSFFVNCSMKFLFEQKVEVIF